jgi:O-antigen/teichoic acid export membrane protein
MIKRLFSSQLRINMVSGAATTIGNLLVAAISYPLYLRFLGYEKYGVWLILSTVMTFAQLGNLGLGPAVMKLVAEERGRRNLVEIQRYVTTALALLFISGSIVLVVLLSMMGPIISVFNLNQQNSGIVLWLLPYIGCLSIYVFMVQALGSALSGLGRMDLANYIQTLGMVVQLVVSGLLLWVGFGIRSLLFGAVTSYLVIHVATMIAIRRVEPLRFLRLENFSIQHSKRLVRFGSTVFAGSVINMLLNPFNKIVLSRYAGVSTVPVYEIAFTGAMQIRTLVEAGFRSITPEISRVSAQVTISSKNRILFLHRQTIKMILFFGVPLYVTLLIFSPVLLKLWLGDRFVDTLPMAFRVMLVGTFMSLMGIPAYYTLLGLGHVRHIFGSHVVQSTANVLAILAVFGLMPLSINSMVGCTSYAMAMSTVYLTYHHTRAMRKIVVSP